MFTKSISNLIARITRKTTTNATPTNEPAERNFNTVLQQIIDQLRAFGYTADADRLIDESSYWAPEIRWSSLGRFFSKIGLNPDSTNEQTVRVYAIYMNKSDDEMRAQFVADGY